MATPDQAHGSPEDASNKAKLPKKSVEQSIAEQSKMAALSHKLESSHRSTEAQSKAKLEIAENIELPWDYLGMEPKNEDTKNQLVDILYAHQLEAQKTDPEYRIVDTPDADLPKLKQEVVTPQFKPGASVVADEKTRNPDTEKADPETAETPDQRNTRLRGFVKDQFSEAECPPEFRDAAAGACESYEDENRELFEEPDFTVTAEDVADLKPEIEKVVEIENNKQAIAAATKKKDTAETVIVHEEAGDRQDKAKIKVEDNKTPKLEDATERAEKQKERDEKQDSADQQDLQTIKENYLDLKSKHGSIGAVEALIGMMKSPKMRGRLNRVLGVMEALQNAIPGKREVTTRLLNQSNLNLGGGSITQVFASFAASVNQSDAYTDEEKKHIHGVLGTQAKVGFNHTVSDMDKSLDRKRKVYDPETGEVIGEEPAFEGEENGLEVREDVIIYTEHGHRYMKNTRTGQVAHLGAGIGEQKHTEAILNFWGAQPELLDKGVERIWNFPLNREEVPTNRQLHNFTHYQQLLEGGARELDATVQRDGEQDNFGTNYLFISQLGEKSPYGFSQDQQNAQPKKSRCGT